MDPQIGQLVSNKYRLVRLIGDGGMGSVYEARHELLGTTVALKFLHAMLARRKGLVDRFLQEAQVSARIKSPHVVTVSDVDRTPDGMAYMVMEYVEGDTLQTLYEKNYHAGIRLSYGDAFEYMLQMIDGVAAAHALSIVHRDLKPDNVMLSSDGAGNTLVKILDFGIAKLKASGEVDRGLTRPGVVMGTPEYMAPEQAFSADRVDARADIFSLGVMFFEMLAGRRPVGGDNAHAIAAQYLEGTIAELTDLAPNIDPELGKAVHKAMAAKPAERFATIGAFRDAIEPFAPSGAPRYKSAKLKAVEEASVKAAAAAATPAASDEGRTSDIPRTVPPEAQAASGSADEAPNQTPTTPESPASASDADGEALRAGTEKMPDGAVAAIQAQAASDPAQERGGTTEMEAIDEAHTSEQPPLVAATESPGGTQVPAHAIGPVAHASPAPAITPHQPHTPAVAPVARPRSGKRKAPSLLFVMLVASLVTGVVVGGVVLAQRYGQEEDIADDTPPIPTQPVTPPVTETDPPAPQPPTQADTPPPATPAPAQPQPQPAQPKTQPQPQPQPQPSTQPSAQPAPKPPPFGIPTVLPSTFPPLFPLPGRTQPQPTTPPAQPTTPPAQPQPTTPPAQPAPAPRRFPRIILRPPQPKSEAPRQPTQPTSPATTPPAAGKATPSSGRTFRFPRPTQ